MEPSAATLGHRGRPDLCPHGVTGRLDVREVGRALLSSWDPLARSGCGWAGGVPGGAEAPPAGRGWRVAGEDARRLRRTPESPAARGDVVFRVEWGCFVMFSGPAHEA